MHVAPDNNFLHHEYVRRRCNFPPIHVVNDKEISLLFDCKEIHWCRCMICTGPTISIARSKIRFGIIQYSIDVSICGRRER